tara:strand:- start:270 stop:410 length:141 start_codon:yes stop_codon:yes gene_type:complete
MLKPREYTNSNSSETVNINKVSNPIRVIDGKLFEVDKRSGDPIKAL